MTTESEQKRNDALLGVKNIAPEKISARYPHYFRDVSKLEKIDIYMVLDLFGVNDQAIGHAIKKLMVAGARGAKDYRKDIQEAIVSLQRRLEILDELGL